MSEKRYTPHCGGSGGDSAQINEHLSQKTLDELVDELAETWDAMNEENFDPQLIDAYLTALDDKDPIAIDFDAEASLAAFLGKHSNIINQLEPVAKTSYKTSSARTIHRPWRMVRLVATIIAVVFGCMITAQALGIDIFGAIVRWTDETFHFDTNTENIQIISGSADIEYSNLKEALSALWEEGIRTVSYQYNWIAGITNLIESLAWSSAGAIAPVSITVFDALSSLWTGLQRTTELDPCEVLYWWEVATTAVFSYVRLESQSDNYQWLSHISTKYTASIAYIADIDFYRQNSQGDWIPAPRLSTGNRLISQQPANYNSLYWAVYWYENAPGGVAHHDAIQQVQISGPESKIVQTIYPCYPQFPLQCE